MRRMMQHTLSSWKSCKYFIPLIALSAVACLADGEFDELAESSLAVTIPARGGLTTFDVASWNIEWYGSTSNGPSNETLQLQNARDVITGTDFDIWGVVEMVGSTQFDSMISQMPGYSGFLANASNVVNGSAYYSSGEQKVGIIYKTGVVTVVSARVILTSNDNDFAGRPPLEVTLDATVNGTTQRVIFIVLHAKAFNDTASWQRRQNASNALKSYLDTTYPTTRVAVVGDYNDDVDTSITSGKPSPYANFVGDPADYFFPTKALTDSGQSSTTGYPDMIDHHLNTNELAASYLAGSVEVYRVDQYIANYDATTSDHFPVLSRYSWGSPVATVTVTAPNGGEVIVGGSAQNITWTATGVSSVNLEYSLNNGASWTSIATGVNASSGTYAWNVPNTASSQALVRVSNASGSPSDTSNSVFTIQQVSSGSAEVFLNEICANEPGSSTTGEFIELVNSGTGAADLSGWTLSDSLQVRHTFAAGTTLNPGQAIVVFGGASAIPPGLGNAVAASTGSLSLNNSGDTVTLRDSTGGSADAFSYSSSLSGQDGVSMNRSPDGNSTAGFVLHTAISSLSTSAGKRASGASW